LYVSEFHTEGALTLKAFADNASVVIGPVAVVQMIVMFMLV